MSEPYNWNELDKLSTEIAQRMERFIKQEQFDPIPESESIFDLDESPATVRSIQRWSALRNYIYKQLVNVQEKAIMNTEKGNQYTTQPAEVQLWDGKLSDQLQRAINDLHTECKPTVVRHLDFAIRSEITALHTSLATVKRMYHAAQKRLDSIDAAQPDPFAVNSQTQPAPAGEYPALPEVAATIVRQPSNAPFIANVFGISQGVNRLYTEQQMQSYADATYAMRAGEQEPVAYLWENIVTGRTRID